MKYTVHAERDSVCMGDDCTAPNSAELEYFPHQTLSRFLSDTVSGYVPKMGDSVWAVSNGGKIIGYIIFDENGSCACEIVGSDIPVSELDTGGLFCRYFYQGAAGLDSYKYTGCTSLIDKVKKYYADMM